MTPFLWRADEVDIDGVRVRFVRREDLALMRRIGGRTKDLRRLAELESLVRGGE